MHFCDQHSARGTFASYLTYIDGEKWDAASPSVGEVCQKCGGPSSQFGAVSCGRVQCWPSPAASPCTGSASSRAWATRVMVCSGMAAPRPADCEKRDSCFPEQNSPG